MNKPVKKELNQLAVQLDGAHTADELTLDEWVTAGKPYCWKSAAECPGERVLYDISRGVMALFSEGKLVQTTRNDIILEQNIVVLGPQYTADGCRIYLEVN